MSLVAAGESVEGARPTAADLLRIENLSVEFRLRGEWTRVIDDVSFSVRRGETLGLVGESGSGKSVTSMAVMRLLPDAITRIPNGRILLEGRDVLSLQRRELEDVRGSRMAMIFQEPMSSLNPAFTVGDQIAETVRRHKKVSRKEAHRRAVQSLSTVGIPDARRRSYAYPHEFSGGMRQRIVMAIALCCEPAVLIADEPTTALDVTIQAQVLDLLREMRDRLGMAVLFVTHDLGVVADICDRVVVMYGGRVMEQAGVVDAFRRPSNPYTQGLLRSMPTTTATELYSIPGQPPVPGAYPEGCRFHPRCPYCIDACREGTVELVSVGLTQQSRCVRAHELELASEEAR